MKKNHSELRPIWSNLCSRITVWVFVIFFLLTLPRIYGTVGGGPGQMIMLGFLLMWFVPWIFLTRLGRIAIGLKLPSGSSWMLWAPLVGFALAFLCYGLGAVFYGASEQHWFQSVAASFFEDERVLQIPRAKLFWMFTIPAMIFSPIGEEILFRGCIQRVVQNRWGIAWGVGVSAILFATVHLLHHGIHHDEEGFKVFWISGFLWWALMMVTSVGFSWLRIKFQSILPAIIAHSFFNLGMNVTIFYLLLP